MPHARPTGACRNHASRLAHLSRSRVCSHRRARRSPARQVAESLRREAPRRLARWAAAGAPRTVTDAAVERVVTLTLETAPRDATHWSTRAMARQCGLPEYRQSDL